MRRLIKPLGALLTVAAATSLSSCNTFDRHDVAASVNGHELTFEQLDSLIDGTTSASVQRDTLTQWVQLAAVTDGPLDSGTAESLNAAAAGLGESLLPEGDGPAKSTYEQGITVSDVVCVTAFQIESSDDADAIMEEITDADSFAAAAAEFSVSEDLAQTGGLITDDSGKNCLPPTSLPLNELFIAALIEADPPVGAAVLIEFGDTDPRARVITRLRPYDELTTADRVTVEHTAVFEAFQRTVASAEVYVNPRLGHWDPTSVSVVSYVE